MSDKTINQLTEDTSPTSDDYFAAWDVGTAAAKKVTLANIITYLRTNHFGYELLGSTTLGVAGDTVTINPITARKNLMIVFLALQSGQIAPTLRFNNDSANNYSYRTSTNGAADGTSVTQGKILISPTETSDQLGLFFVTNRSATEKLAWGTAVSFGTAGSGNAPTRIEGGAKWVNTASQITRVDLLNIGTGDFAIGTQLLVMGRD